MNPQKEYLLTRVRSASPMELVSILYETAIQSTEEALAALRSGEIMRRGEAVNRAVETIFELQSSLRHDVQPEYSQNLAELYGYMQRGLSQAHLEKSERMFEEVARLLRTLLEGWSGAVQNLAAQTSATEADPALRSVHSGSPYVGGLVSGQKERSWSL